MDAIMESIQAIHRELDSISEIQQRTDCLLDYLETVHSGRLKHLENPATLRSMGVL